MKKYILCSIFILAQTIQAQIIETPFCATDQLHEQRLATDTAYAHQFEINQQLIREFCDPHNHAYNENTRNLVVLPMVVHIVSPPGTPIGTGNNITDTQVEQGLQMLNDAFANSGSFSSSDGVDTEIQFCLAQRDPLGQPTTGITRDYSNIVADPGCGGNGFVMGNESVLFSLSNWECCEYINVYLVTNITDNGNYGCSIAGYATVGSSCGYMIQESGFWTTAYGTQVSAHEMGHFFGLWHTFQGGCSNTGSCLVDGDAVCDTPPDNQTFSPCSANSCNTDTPDLPDDTQNYMDYGACTPWHFTQGQKVRMTATLLTTQNCLLNSQGCVPAINWDAALLALTAPDGTCGTQLCPTITFKNTGINTLTNVQFTYNINGGGLQVFNYTTPVLPNTTATTILPCLPTVNGVNTVTVTITLLNGNADGYLANNTISQTFDVFEMPALSIVQADSTHCGYNGFVRLQTTGGQAPYQYQILGNLNWQTSADFNDLQNITYTFTVKDANNCTSTVSITLPDICPPCISGVINNYAAVTNICANNLQLSVTDGFHEGDKVLMIQMQGATISLNNDATFGDILDYGNAGNYEFNRIAVINGNTVSLQYQIMRTYDVLGKVQLISVPEFEDITVCNLTCQAWNGETGGVLVLDASGTVSMAGNIDVSGKGLRGFISYEDVINVAGCGTLGYVFPYGSGDGAIKGEGITLSNPFQNTGRGKYANGGGGGNDHNGGGGGGGNYGQGGFGGYVVGFVCGFLNQGNGVGGANLQYSNLEKKIFIGGGGGSGEIDAFSDVKKGGNGGGIIIFKSDSIQNPSSSFIISNGESVPANTGGDGNSGGGSGGTILIDTNNSDNLTIQAKGGDGGSCNNLIYDYFHGPGGGGGGGLVWLSQPNPSFSFNVIGGLNGISDNNSPHGSTQGSPGGILYDLICPHATSAFQEIELDNLVSYNCNSESASLEILTQGATPPYQYALNNGAWQSSNNFQNLIAGSYLVSVKDACNMQKDTLLIIATNHILADSLIFQQGITCTELGKIIISGTGGTPPYQYQINGGAWQNNGTFTPLIAGNYTLTTRDANNCTVTRIITLENNISTPLLNIDELQNITCDTTGAVRLSLSGSNGFYLQYNLDGDTIQSNPTFTNLAAGNHTVTVTDELGCSGSVTFTIADNSQTFTVNNPQQICTGETYSINGNSYINSGIYTDTLLSIGLCDSIVVTQLTVHNLQTITQNATTCNPADVGSITTTYTAATGCDSTVTVITTLLDSYNLTQNATSCNPADVGSVTTTYTATTGCDSTVTVITTLLDSYNLTQNATSCNPADVGSVSTTYTAATGCDSTVTVIITLLDSYNLTQNATTCNPADVGSVSTTYTATTGCDSTVTVITTLLDSYNLTQNATSCNPADVGSVSTTYTATTGCDSTVTVITTLLDSYNLTQNATTCNPADVGSVSTTYTAATGCDSTVTVITTLLDSYNLIQNATSCNPADVGSVSTTYTAATGCDSTVTVITTLLDSYNLTQNATSCNPADVGSVSTTYTAATGCDSTVTVITTLLDSYNLTQNATSCNPADVGSISTTYTATTGCDSTVTVITTLLDSYNLTQNATSCNPADVGSISTTYTAATGCDSTITVITTLLQSYNLTQNATSCNPADVGSVSTTYTAATGCDSTVTVITTLIDIPICDDNDCNTTDIFNEETCECEHIANILPNCDDNNPATSDIYNAQTCDCEHVIDKHYILIPNAFSPNNDGVNDAFTVTAIGASYIQAFIYNRWGQLVYESNNSSASWDGTYKGKLQEIGVYVYLVTITYEDGSFVIKKGNITLIN